MWASWVIHIETLLIEGSILVIVLERLPGRLAIPIRLAASIEIISFGNANAGLS